MCTFVINKIVGPKEEPIQISTTEFNMAPYCDTNDSFTEIKFTCPEVQDLVLKVYWTIVEAAEGLKSQSIVGSTSSFVG